MSDNPYSAPSDNPYSAPRDQRITQKETEEQTTSKVHMTSKHGRLIN